MKGIIDEIFKKVYGQSEEGQVCDRELTEEVNCIIELMETELHNDKLSDFIFDASGYGQKLGFISSFKFGIQFMCECL